jgi:hypothetical protein
MFFNIVLFVFMFHRTSHWESFIEHLQLLTTNSFSLRTSTTSLEVIKHWICDNDNKFQVLKPKRHNKCCITALRLGVNSSTLWVPIDMYLEDCVDGSVAATNSIEMLAGTISIPIYTLLSCESAQLFSKESMHTSPNNTGWL